MRWIIGFILGGFLVSAALAKDPENWDEIGPVPPPTKSPRPQDVAQAIRQGVDFLLRDQNKNGSWGNPTRTKDLNIYAPVPGSHHAFRAGVTSLAVSALIESEDDRPAVREAIDRGEAWLRENLPKLRRANATALYNVWGHAYGISALVDLHQRQGDDPTAQAELRELIAQQVELLERYESVDGGWGYYDFRAGAKHPSSDSTSFTTATGLVALAEAKAIGVPVPEKLSRRAVDSVLRQQKRDLSYLYGEYLKTQPLRLINRPAGSLGRTQACNIALRMWGDDSVSDKAMKTWLHRLVARNLWLDIGRKRPVPHESWAQVAGYFYYYGHFYAALCIEDLPVDERGPFQDHLARIILDRQEKDGSWWDFPFYAYHQPYGTAFGVMTLARCRRR